MNRDRYSFQVCCLMERGTKADAFEREGFPVHTFAFRPGLSPVGIIGNLFKIFRLASLMRRLGVDVVHTHDNQPAAYARVAAWMAGVSIVYVTYHNDYTWLHPIHHRLNRLLAYLTTRIIAVSYTVRDISLVKDGISERKYRVIYNGVMFAPPVQQEQLDRYRDTWGLGPTARVIGNVASLSERKGQDLLLEAFGRIARDFPNVFVIIVGSRRDDEPGVQEELASIAARYNIGSRVIFAGSREDVFALLNLFDIFVMPSRIEGFGLSLVEAMCAGVPAVISDIRTFRELSENGKHALLFRSGEAEDLAIRLRYALNNQAEMVGRAEGAKRYARERFGMDRMLAAYEALYEEDLGRR